MTDSRKATVSLCLIVRNEAHQLEECLAPVAPLFDEVVVVDTGSRDATKQIAARFAPQVFDFPWCDDFSAARNESLRRATGEWIFWLDADDRLEPADIERLRCLLSGLNGQPQAFVMDTVCPSRFACDGASLISHVRLFRNHPDVHWQGRVHEQLSPALTAAGYTLLPADVRIQHLGYHDAGAHQRKLQRDLRLLRMDFALDPDRPSTLVHLGLTNFHLGKNADARQCFQRLLSSGPAPHDYLRQVYGVLATMSLQEGQPTAALSTLERALQHFPDDEHLLYLQADCLYELDRFDDAQQALLKILTSGEGWHYHGGVPSDIRSKLAPRKLGEVLRIKRSYALAEAQLRAVVNRFPDETISWYLLGRVYVDLRQAVQLGEVIQCLQACPQGTVFALLLLAMWHMDIRDFSAAQQYIDQAIGLAPQLPLARVLRAECLMRSGATQAAQAQACRDILRVQPGNVEAACVLARGESGPSPAPATLSSQYGSSVVVTPGAPGGLSAI